MDPNLWLWTAGRTWGLRWGFGSFAAAAAHSVLRWSPEKDKSQDVRFPEHPWPAKCIPALYRCLVYNVTVLLVDNLFSLFVHLIDIYIYTLYTRGVWEDWFSQWLSCTLWFWVCLPKSPIDIYINYYIPEESGKTDSVSDCHVLCDSGYVYQNLPKVLTISKLHYFGHCKQSVVELNFVFHFNHHAETSESISVNYQCAPSSFHTTAQCASVSR